MNVTNLIQKLERQLQIAETLADKHSIIASRLRQKLANVAKILGGSVNDEIEKTDLRRTRKLTSAGRRRIVLAQHRRWAAIRAKSLSRNGTVRKKGRRKISAAGLARIRAAQFKRWAAVHARSGKRSTSLLRGKRNRTRKISARGLANIRAAQFRRWAAVRAKQS